MLYDNGGKVQITPSFLVRCDGKLIGHLVRSGDEEKRWWDLEVYDMNRVYVHDGVFSEVAQTESIQGIGEYLDKHFGGS